MTKPALVIIDLQKVYVGEPIRTVPTVANAAEYINYVAGLFREKQLPVIFIYDKSDVAPGQPSFEMVDDLKIETSDHKVHKMHGNSFRDTDLEPLLKRLGVGFLLIAGFRAENCVLATIHGAMDRDIPFALLQHGILSTSEDGAAFVQKSFPIAGHPIVKHFF